MAEHAETFMSLYTVDMDGALQVQPVDSWDSFPLFQLLNNFLRYDREFAVLPVSLFFHLWPSASPPNTDLKRSLQHITDSWAQFNFQFSNREWRASLPYTVTSNYFVAPSPTSSLVLSPDPPFCACPYLKHGLRHLPVLSCLQEHVPYFTVNVRTTKSTN